MAVSCLPDDDDDYINTNDTHLEIFSLIWLDGNINDNRNTEQKLRSIINHLKKFRNIEQCQQFIEQTTQKDRLILIVSGRMGQEIVPSIHKFRQVISIYVYCMDKKLNEEWASKYTKIKAVAIELDELVSRIQTDYKIQEKVEEPLLINIFTTKTHTGKSTIGVNGEFVFSQILIDCLLQLEPSEIDRNELINLCKKQYEDNMNELNYLQEFEQDYSSDKVLWWYTRETFFYKTLNAALRTQNIHMIFLFRAFISDIYYQLHYNQTKRRLRVYRSQLMSNDELDVLKQNIGQLISVNSFFSTSVERHTALFLLGDTSSPIDLERVLFEIDADPNVVTTKPFADISEHSHFTNESEVLFMLGSIFRLASIQRSVNQVWLIQMILSSDDQYDLKNVLIHMKQHIESDKINLHTLGKILWKMGKLDLAEKYFYRLLEELPASDPLRCDLFENLGELASLRGNYDMSIEWHRKSLVCKNEDRLSCSPNTYKTVKCGITHFISHITNNSRWKQHGITIVGGNDPGHQLNQLDYPHGLYIDDDYLSIYIVDCWNHRIIEWQSDAKIGQVIAGGNGRGNQIYQLNHPTDVLIDTKADSLIICDRGNRRIVEWSRQNLTYGQIIISDVDCEGIAMDQNGNLYVTDRIKNEVRRWKKGQTYGTLVAGGNGKGDQLNQLNYPTYIFVDQDYSIYISDNGNHRVMKWMKNAKEGLVVAGGHGQGNQLTQLDGPEGVYVDHLGNVYVADFANHRIVCWTKGSRQGRIIVGGNGQGEQPNQLNWPVGLSFDREDSLYVVDSMNHRVQKFAIN